MRLTKAEVTEGAALLEAGAETPEVLAQDLNRLFDRHRANRLWYFGLFRYAGVPGVVGPYSTRNQVTKALAELGPDKCWVIPGWTAEGWVRLLEAVDAAPEPLKLTEAERKRQEKGFWSRAFAIKNHEGLGVIAESVKVLRVPKGPPR